MLMKLTPGRQTSCRGASGMRCLSVFERQNKINSSYVYGVTQLNFIGPYKYSLTRKSTTISE